MCMEKSILSYNDCYVKYFNRIYVGGELVVSS